MEDRTILYADEGMILTDGINYGTIIYLAEGADPTVYHQITEEEHNAIMAQTEVT